MSLLMLASRAHICAMFARMTNPFEYSSPLAPDELLDRDDEAQRLLERAEGGHNSRLVAPRRYGKTSLLLRVLDEAEDRAGPAST